MKRKVVTHRKPDLKYNEQLDRLHHELLGYAKVIFEKTSGLDTAVRDSVSLGLAYLVEAAYDCKASTLDLDTEAFFAFIETSTAQWFRSRGFADWFCVGAASLFRTSRPRTIQEMQHRVVHYRAGKTKWRKIS